MHTDLAGDSNVEGFATSNSILLLLDRDKCKNAPRTPQELQANLQNTPNGASSGRFHSDAQVSLAKPPKNYKLRISARPVCTLWFSFSLCVTSNLQEWILPSLHEHGMSFIYFWPNLSPDGNAWRHVTHISPYTWHHLRVQAHLCCAPKLSVHEVT